ncbi:MAG: hypothetical protein ACREA0_26845, partial [bacterium]
RGQDMWTKFCTDVLAMREIQQEVANALGLDGCGELHGFIASAHVYMRDVPAVASIRGIA